MNPLHQELEPINLHIIAQASASHLIETKTSKTRSYRALIGGRVQSQGFSIIYRNLIKLFLLCRGGQLKNAR